MRRWGFYLVVVGLLAAVLATPAVGQAVARLFGSDTTTGGASPIRATSGALHVVIDGSAAAITAGSGTGVTVNEAGDVRTLIYKVTVAYTNFVANAQTADLTIATLPAKTRLVGLYADLVTPFVCAATCTTGTLSMTLGSAAGGNQLLVSFDADAAAAVFGDADNELGTSINAAGRIQNAWLPSWSETQIVSLRLTSGTGNVGNGTATNLNAGSVTFYLITEVLP